MAHRTGHGKRLVAGLLLAGCLLPTLVGADDWPRLDRQFNHQYRQGQYGAAEATARQALTVAGQQPASTGQALRQLSSLNALALAQQAQGHLEAARAGLEQALALAANVLPAEHANVRTVRGNLVSVEQALQQQHAQAALSQVQALNEQALVLHEQGAYAEAAALYEQVLPPVRAHFGERSREAARVLTSLADTLAARRQYPQAEQVYDQALAIYEGLDEPLALAAVLNAQAAALYMRRQYGQAEPLFQRALALLEQERGPVHADLLPVLDNLVALYQTLRRDAQAAPYRQQATRVREAVGDAVQ